MQRKGIPGFRFCDHLTFRRGDPTRDRDARGEPIHDGYAVPVSTRTCRDQGGLLRREWIENAPCLPGLIFTRSNMAYGPWRRQTRGRYAWRKLDDLTPQEQRYWWLQIKSDPELLQNGYVWRSHDVYWTKPVYWIEDARVYRATIYAYDEPRGY